MIALYIIHIIVCFFLVFHALGWLISIFVYKNKSVVKYKERKFAAIITGYKNAKIAAPLIESILNQTYINYEIFFVADSCDTSDIEWIKSKFKINIIAPENPLNSKIKSIKEVINILDDSFNSILVLDPDNVLHPDFIHLINEKMNNGYEAVQGQRRAKNLDTNIACLDAIGEFYYNVNTRLIPFKIGSSATIAGSGMAISIKTFKEYLNLTELKENNGKVIISEDKILQNFIITKGLTIAYEENAIVFDEKVTTTTQLQRQRTRWINTWFKHIFETKNIWSKFSWNSLWFGFLTAYPPMFIQWISAFILLALDIFISKELAISIITCMIIFSIHFFNSLRLAKAPNKVIFALKTLPIFVIKQVVSLLQMKKSNSDFMVTEHKNNIGINELLITKL